MLTKKQQILKDMPYEVLRFLCEHKNRTLLSRFVLNAMYGESTIFERMCRGTTGRFTSAKEAKEFYARANENPTSRYWYCMDYFMYAFVWNHTTEGNAYWNRVYWKFWEYMDEYSYVNFVL